MKLNKINLFLLIFSIVATIVSLIAVILSIVVYDDGYGISYSSNEDYVIILLGSLVFLIYAIYKFVKNDNAKILYKDAILITEAALVSLYPLGIFFKALTKAIAKGKQFVFNDYSFYLFLGIAGLALLIYAIIKFIEDKKQTKESYND